MPAGTQQGDKLPLHVVVVSSYLDTMQNDVRKLREARGLSQGELAERLSVSRQTVNSIETGRYLPSLPLAIAIGRFFERAVEEIFRDDDHR
jgi:putative transcriptional regulator